MDLKKRILSLVLALVLVLSCVSAFADEEVPATKITLSDVAAIDWLAHGEQEFSITATVEGAEGKASTQKVVWSVSDEKIAKKQSDDPIAGINYKWFDVIGPGKVTVTAEAVKADGTKTGVKATKEVEIKLVKETKVEFTNAYALSVGIGGGLWVSDYAKISPDNASYGVYDMSWSSSDTSIASVTTYGYVRGVKAGKVTITATAKGDPSVKGTVEVEVKEDEAETAITSMKFNAEKYYFNFSQGNAYMANYLVVEPEDYTANIVWTVDDTSVATVSQYGRLDFLKAGTVKVTATAGTVSASATVVINDIKPYTMSFAQKDVKIKLNETYEYELIFDPYDAAWDNITIEISDSEVLGYSDYGSYGYFYANKSGTATVTAKAYSNDVLMATATCTVTVEGTALESVSFKKDLYELPYGRTWLNLTDELVFKPENFRIDWDTAGVFSVSDPTIAEIVNEEYGIYLYAKKAGKVKVTFTVGGDATLSATTTVVIDTIALEKVKFEDKKYIMGYSESADEANHTYLYITPVFTPLSATIKNVKFESTNANVATANYVLGSAGSQIEVQANGLGKAVITAYFDDGVETKEASFTVVVTDKITKVKLNKTKKTLYMKPKALRTYQLVAKDATTRAKFGADMIKWKSSNKKVATVDENGLVTAKGVGTCTITATVKDKLKKSATCIITVKKKKNLK